MRRMGAEEPSFPSIVAAGEHGALPHAEPRDAEIPAGELVMIDWGALLDGYCSDCTRTLATGEVDGEVRRSTTSSSRRRPPRWRRWRRARPAVSSTLSRALDRRGGAR